MEIGIRMFLSPPLPVIMSGICGLIFAEVIDTENLYTKFKISSKHSN